MIPDSFTFRSCAFFFSTMVLLLSQGCGRGPEAQPSKAFLREVRSIVLDESRTDPIVAISDLTVSDDGGMHVVDGPAGRIRHFDANGRRLGETGRPGSGPGELRQPTSLALSGDTLFVVERGSPRLTTYVGDSHVAEARVPGQYGFRVGRHGADLIVGIGTQNERFAIVSRTGAVRARFGTRAERFTSTPYWIFFAREHAALMSDRILINTSFDPVVRIHDLNGDSLGAFGVAPANWQPPTEPPAVEKVDAETREGIIAEWSRSFSVVSQMEVIADSLLIVGYGRHDPQHDDPNFVVHASIDVHARDGTKILEGIPFPWAIVAGGEHLYIIREGPPWRISVLELVR